MSYNFVQNVLMGAMLSILAKNWIDIFEEIMDEEEN